MNTTHGPNSDSICNSTNPKSCQANDAKQKVSGLFPLSPIHFLSFSPRKGPSFTCCPVPHPYACLPPAILLSHLRSVVSSSAAGLLSHARVCYSICWSVISPAGLSPHLRVGQQVVLGPGQYHRTCHVLQCVRWGRGLSVTSQVLHQTPVKVQERLCNQNGGNRAIKKQVFGRFQDKQTLGCKIIITR